jgi:uncharacterized protein YcbK (DUF882 family)
MNAVSGFAPIAAPEYSESRDAHTPDDTSSESFAGILAGAIHHTHAHTPKPAKKAEGTSELDKSENSDTTASASADETDGGDNAATSANSAAAAAPADTSGANDVVRSVAALDPTLQAKLTRVMERVKDETGLDVKVAETYRSQSRQDTLFAQGRETAGPVVTWTQNSKHTQGRAADLVMSGGSGAEIAAGYKALQRIANEEGLRTLGAKDPGHLELPSSGSTNATPLSPAALADASGPSGVSVARVAQLARVSGVSVAGPAQVARVAGVARADTGSVAAKPNSATTSVSGVAIAGISGDASGSADGGQFSSSRDSRSGADTRYSALSAAVAMRAQRADAFSVPGVGGTTGSTSVDRTARILDALDNAPARPLSQITMNVDAANGGTDRVQLSLRGASLNATIDTADPRAAQAMTARGDELSRALTRDGIELESLHVRTGATVAAGTPTATPSSQSSSDTSTSSRWERNQAWQQQDKQRSQQDRRNQQREQRGDSK